MPPLCQTKLVRLGLCDLHVMEAGDGPPLVVVPATVLEVENWSSLVQFMSQWFHVYFFELPGHGKSTPLQDGFSSDRVAICVAELVDWIGADCFSLMGFSFGGRLAMKTYLLLQDRIDQPILLSPCLTARALGLSRTQRRAASAFNRLLKMEEVRTFLVDAMRLKAGRRGMALLIHLVGKVQNTRQLEHNLERMPPPLVEIVACELDKILNAEFLPPPDRHEAPCCFAMSVHDPLLDYRTTRVELDRHFANSQVFELKFPFHQPPRAFTLEELNEQFRSTVNEFLTDFRPSSTAHGGHQDRSIAIPGNPEPSMPSGLPL
jgi:pimeloyl-ACP methyl ester carboxylesterase